MTLRMSDALAFLRLDVLLAPATSQQQTKEAGNDPKARSLTVQEGAPWSWAYQQAGIAGPATPQPSLKSSTI